MHLGIYMEINCDREGVPSNTYGNLWVKSNTINLLYRKDIKVPYQRRQSVRNQARVNIGNSTLTTCF